MILVLAAPWLWLAAFLGAPLAIVVVVALAEPADAIPPYAPGWHFENLALAVLDPFYRDALLNSLWVASVATLACLAIGYPMALAIARSAPRWRDTLLLAAMLPFWTGFLMRINAWIGLLRDDGPIDALGVWFGLGPARLLYTDTAMYLGLVYTYLPFMVLPLFAALSRRETALEQAAADLGASPWGVFARITLPLSARGVVAGCALVFLPVVGEYVVPELLGPPGASLVGRVVWGEFFANRDWPMAAALAVIVLVVLLLPAAALRRWKAT